MAATGITNTVLMAAYERVGEIGMLRAMGMTRPAVLGLFILEGLVMGSVGGLIGGALGAGLVGYYATHGIDFSFLIDNAEAPTGVLPMSAILYMEFSWGTVGAAMLFGVVVAALASLYPAWMAGSMQPAEAVRAT
jgi:putative ABC transport system permease protein